MKKLIVASALMLSFAGFTIAQTSTTSKAQKPGTHQTTTAKKTSKASTEGITKADTTRRVYKNSGGMAKKTRSNNIKKSKKA
jgi:hypothetical protein